MSQIDPIQDHLDSICAQAGLGVMTGIFSVLRDREVLTDQQMLGLSDADVTQMYEDFVGPAIDGIQDRVINA